MLRYSRELIPGMHRFGHEAMATVFEVMIVHPDELFARQAAEAAFEEIDRLERYLSRYVENSDIARLNALKPGRTLPVSPETFDCLVQAQRIYEMTGGLFDATIGPLFACWHGPDKKVRQPTTKELETARGCIGMELLVLNAEQLTVEVKKQCVQVDLGGIGKGYAVDMTAEFLYEWELDTALVSGGGSTVRALREKPPGQNGWPLTLSNPLDRGQTWVKFGVLNETMSGSGIGKGPHIIHPHTGAPVEGKLASWVWLPGDGDWPATQADALTTALMLMNNEQIDRLAQQHPRLSILAAFYDEHDDKKVGEIRRWGPWKNAELIYEKE